jgi:hypothetical protein
MTGSQPFAVLLCKPADQPNEPQPASWFQGFLAGPTGLAGYWRDQGSPGGFSLAGTQVFGWRSLPINLAALNKLGRGDRIKACMAAFPDVRFSSFFSVIAVVSSSGDYGSADGKVLLSGPANWNLTAAAHETGHALGLDHSFDDSPTSCDPGDDSRPGAYGDSWDIMSAFCFGGGNPTFRGAFSTSGPGLSGPYRYKLGWIPEGRVFTFVAGFDVRSLAALTHPEAAGDLLIKHYVNNTDYFTIEYRRATGWDQAIGRDSVLIHLVKNNGLSYLIRANGGPERLAGSRVTLSYNRVSSSGVVIPGSLDVAVTALDSASSTATVRLSGG